jgi:glycerophosphoryl diester phosphodiesterase
VALGYRYLETDAHATADGVALAVHDPELERVSDGSGAIRTQTLAQLAPVRLGDDRPVPRLDELLDRWPDCRWNIDIKHPTARRAVVDTIRRCGATERVLVTAFNDARIAAARRSLGPQLATGIGPAAIAALRIASWVAPGHARGSRAAAAQVPLRYFGTPVIDAAFIRTAHGAGLAVHVWTIDEAEVMHRLLDLGVDGIMTDRPSLLKSVLAERGVWA